MRVNLVWSLMKIIRAYTRTVECSPVIALGLAESQITGVWIRRYSICFILSLLRVDNNLQNLNPSLPWLIKS